MGLSCHSTVHPETALKKGPFTPGHVLVLTKALGTGVLMAADMRAMAKGAWLYEAFESMVQSNKAAARILAKYGCSACTDVTGFGLLGHLLEMLQYDHASETCRLTPYSQKLSAELNVSEIPILSGAAICIDAGVTSSLQEQNVRSSKAIGNSDEELASFDAYPLLFDPQTSGGLLASVPANRSEEVITELRQAGYHRAKVIGKVDRVVDLQGAMDKVRSDVPPDERPLVWLK